MFGPRSPRYPLLRAYLASRPAASRPLIPRRTDLAVSAGIFVGVAGMMELLLGQAGPIAACLSLVVAATLGTRAYLAKPALPPTAEEELALRADAVVRQLGSQTEWNRLHRAFHPAVAATLEECAGYHARVVAALDEGDWEHRSELRASALAAANLAMDEAIVHAGKTLPHAPEPRPLEQLSDTLEDIGFGPLTRDGRAHEPVPSVFRPVRELAERLRELAVRSETAAAQRREASPEPVSAAFRHLDAALGEMRRIEEAEGELRQGA